MQIVVQYTRTGTDADHDGADAHRLELPVRLPQPAASPPASRTDVAAAVAHALVETRAACNALLSDLLAKNPADGASAASSHNKDDDDDDEEEEEESESGDSDGDRHMLDMDTASAPVKKLRSQ